MVRDSSTIPVGNDLFDNRRQRPDEKLLPKGNWQYDRVSGAAATGRAEGRGTRY